MDTLVHFGGSVKALGDGKVGGYLIRYGDESTPDLSRERDYFTKATDLDIAVGDHRSTYYSHGLDAKMGVKKIGTLTVTDMEKDDLGVWVEAQLSLRDEYEKAVYKMAEDGKLGWSSGAPSHLVTRKTVETKSGDSVHEILTWPIAEGSLTPTPAEPRCQAIALKSLSSLLGMDEECGCDDDNKKQLPDGWSYRDLMNFLESEANEDFGAQGSTDLYGMYTPSVMIWGCNLLENPDRFVYRRTDAPGDQFARPFTITNNDAIWGDEQEVIETTTYVDAPNDDMASMMAGKQADVTALKEALTRSMTFSDHADIATSAMEGFVARAEKAIGMDVKAGRVISAANRAKMQKIHAGMQVAHDAMAEHMGTMGRMLAETDPDAKKDAEDFAALRTRFVRLQSELLHMSS